MAVYCCSDLHGMYNLYEKICAKLKPEDKVIFLGDANDRGPDGWKLIRTILNNPQWVYLMGNHEDMLVKAIDEAKMFDEGMYGYACLLHQNNGGKKTFEDCLKDNEGFEVIEQLRNLPLYYHYISPVGVEYWLTHAGYTPLDDDPTPINYPNKKTTLLWNRDHFCDNFTYRKDFYIIHGHTPVEYCYDYTINGEFMDEKNHSPYLYGKDMKIDIDAGAFYTNETFLFNLDEFSFEVIKEKKETD